METHLPHSSDAERSTLGAILLEPKNFGAVVPLLAEGDFYDKKHAAVYGAMIGCRSKAQEIDLLTVFSNLDPKSGVDLPYVSGLTDGVPKMGNAKFYADIVKRESILRSQLLTAHKVERYLSEGGKDVLFAAEQTRHIRNDALSQESDAQSISNVMDGLLENAHKRQDGELEGDYYSTGSCVLDKFFHYEKGKLYVVGGRPSMGKTAWALQQSVTLCKQGLAGLMFEQEMPAEEIGTRLAASEGRVPFTSIRDVNPDRPLMDEDWERLGQAYERINEQVDLEIVDRPGRSIHDVEAEIISQNAHRESEDLPPLGFLIFDYIQIANLGDKNRVEAVQMFTARLKEIAREYNLIVIALSQLSRPPKDAYDKQGVPRLPQLSDLRDSGAIEQDADLVLFCHRPEHYLATGGHDVAEWAGVAQMSVAKNRGGPTGAKKMGWMGELMIFSDPWFETGEDE